MLPKILHFVKEYKKLLIVAFIAGLFLPKLYSPSLQASLINYSQYGDDTEEALIDYHVQVNEITNEFINTLLSEEDPNVLYVENATDCESGNVSTYCLAVKLNEELLGLELYLVDHLDDVTTSETITGDDVDDSSEINYNSLEDVIAASAKQKTMVLDEMEAAEDSLDLLLYVYNQLQLVYPVHKALNSDSKTDSSLMKSLENLNNALSDVRGDIEQLPSKFNDATMVECK